MGKMISLHPKDFQDTEWTSLTIHQLREQLRLTSQELSNRLGVSISTVSRWETGVSKPSKLAVSKLDELLAKH